MSTLTEPYKVLVAEKIADTGVQMLRDRFDVDLGTDWTREELLDRISSYHGILIRSATKLDAEVIDRADNLRVVGRAGVGVDNVDVAAASKRGIIVANAPEANTVAAAEHTVALMLALARNIPQAHASLISGKWERSKFGGTEVEGKTLGVLGFGRIGQLVATRARAFGMRVVAYDPFVSTERFRELGVEKAETPEDVLKTGDFITLHLPQRLTRLLVECYDSCSGRSLADDDDAITGDNRRIAVRAGGDRIFIGKLVTPFERALDVVAEQPAHAEINADNFSVGRGGSVGVASHQEDCRFRLIREGDGLRPDPFAAQAIEA